MNFVHLNLHTEYSIVDGIVRIEELMPICVKAQMPAIAVTDQNNLFAWVKFYRQACAAGIKPIVGINVWLQHIKSGQAPNRIILLAQNDIGYKNIIQLISCAYLSPSKTSSIKKSTFDQPVIERAWLEELNTGIIALSGGMRGDVGEALINCQDNMVNELVAWWQKFFPERFYLELQRTGKKQEEDYIELALDLAEKYELPVVATNATRFLNPGDFEAHEARVCINAGFVLEDSKRPRDYSEQQYLRTPDEMLELFSDIPEALANTVEIAKRCSVELTLGKHFLPIFPIPEGINIDVATYLQQQAEQGLTRRLSSLDDESRERYQQRLHYELNIIKQMGFPSYFLIVADFICWAKNNGVPVGPGRGSGAGSLVAYALGITDLDPLKYDLLFERFLNPERVSLPDFDVDFCMEGRDRVIEYVTKRYGSEKVSQIITYGTMAARAVVRDVGRVLGFTYGFVDKIAKLIPFELGISLDKALDDKEGLLRKRYEEEEEVRVLIDLAKKLEGIVRNAGKHAGGVVIAPSSLIDFMPLYREEGDASASVVTQFDKDDVEAVGLVKFDFLGLRTLTIINWAVQNINTKCSKSDQDLLDITNIPLDDEATYQLIKNGATTAVFQVESRGMRDLIKRLQPDCFDDIVALVALYRPGPLQSGMVDDFVNRKHGQEPITYLHPLLEPVLKNTYGVILYQEQVMQIAQVLAGYSLGSADILRKAMGKKKPEEMARQRTIFVEGAIKKDIDKHLANTVFDLMEKFAGYGFNKSHSAAYALISYQTAWLKTHYPAEFMAAVLSSDMDNTDKVVVFIDECKNLQLQIVAPDINICSYKFTVGDDGSIVYGLGAIKGVGQAALENILANRDEKGPFIDLFDFCCRCDGRKVNKRVVEALIYAGAFDKIAPNRASLLASLPQALQLAEQQERNSASGQLDLFSMVDDDDIAAQEENKVTYTTVTEWSKDVKLKHEKSVLGLYLSGHPMHQYWQEVSNFASGPIVETAQIRNKSVLIAGFVAGVRLFNTRTGNRLAVVRLEDHTGNIELTVFSDLYVSTREILQEGQLLVAEAEITIDNFTGNERARALTIRTLEQARMTYARYLEIKLNDANITNRELTQLEHILQKYKTGTCPVYIYYVQKNVSVPIRLHNTWQVQPKDALLCELKALLGEANIVIHF